MQLPNSALRFIELFENAFAAPHASRVPRDYVPLLIHTDSHSKRAVTRLEKVPAVFYQKTLGAQPVRDVGLSREDRRVIGNDIATVEYGWPDDIDIARKLEKEVKR